MAADLHEGEKPEVTAPSSDEPVWVRNRRIRLEAMDAANAHGQSLAERYGGGYERPRYALMSRRKRRR